MYHKCVGIGQWGGFVWGVIDSMVNSLLLIGECEIIPLLTNVVGVILNEKYILRS